VRVEEERREDADPDFDAPLELELLLVLLLLLVPEERELDELEPERDVRADFAVLAPPDFDFVEDRPPLLEALRDFVPDERLRPLDDEPPPRPSSSPSPESPSPISFFATPTAAGIATPNAAPATTLCVVDRPSVSLSFPSCSSSAAMVHLRRAH
jgi:hypothetical protein